MSRRSNAIEATWPASTCNKNAHRQMRAAGGRVRARSDGSVHRGCTVWCGVQLQPRSSCGTHGVGCCGLGMGRAAYRAVEELVKAKDWMLRLLEHVEDQAGRVDPESARSRGHTWIPMSVSMCMATCMATWIPGRGVHIRAHAHTTHVCTHMDPHVAIPDPVHILVPRLRPSPTSV